MYGLRKKFSYQLLFAFSQLAFPLLTYPYITRTIGAEGIGVIGFVEYVSAFIITVVAFGIPYYGVREIAKAGADTAERLQLFRQLFTIHFLCSILGVVVFACFILLNGKQTVSLPLLFLGSLNILLPPFIAEWYMQGIEAFRFTTVRTIVLRLAGVLAIYLFVASSSDYIVYYSIIILVQVFLAFTNLYKIGFRHVRLTTAGIQNHLKPLLHFFLSASLISIYVFFDVIILGFFADEKAVGYYTVALKTIKLSLFVVFSLNVVLFPRISQLTTTESTETIQQLIHTGLSFIILLTLPISIGFLLLAPQIIQVLAGDNFAPSIQLVQILSFLPMAIGLSNLFGYQILISFGREKKLLSAVIITCICSLVLHLTLVMPFGASGTAEATLITEILMALLTGIFAVRIFRFSFPFTTLFQSLLALGPFVAGTFIAQQFFTNSLSIILICTTTGMTVYLLLQLFLFKNSLVRETVSSLAWRRKTGFE